MATSFSLSCGHGSETGAETNWLSQLPLFWRLVRDIVFSFVVSVVLVSALDLPMVESRILAFAYRRLSWNGMSSFWTWFCSIHPLCAFWVGQLVLVHWRKYLVRFVTGLLTALGSDSICRCGQRGLGCSLVPDGPGRALSAMLNLVAAVLRLGLRTAVPNPPLSGKGSRTPSSS